MYMLELLQLIQETLIMLFINKAERGNVLVLFPALLGACWLYSVRLQYRRRKWLQLTPAQQMQYQRDANLLGKYNEPYPM